jgi:hypothetical protein
VARPEWTPQQRAEYRQNTLEELHAQLAEQVAKLDSIDAWQQWLGLARSLHSYSFSNVLLIAAQRADATMVAGFSTWKQKGRSVRKGEKAIRILAPILRKMPVLDDAGNQVRDEHGEPRVRRQLVGAKPVSVFDASQVEPPVETPPQPQLLTGQAPPGLWESLVDLAAIEGFTVTRGDCGTANGFISFAAHEIRIRPDVDDLQACKSLCHELGHALTMGPEDAAAYATQRELREVEAESVAYTVLGAHGVDTSQYTFDYVAGWAARAATADTSVHDIIVTTGQRVIAAANRILSHTKPEPSLEDELVDQWARTIEPALVLTPEPESWEVVTDAPSRAPRVEQAALPHAQRRTPGVPR